MIEFALASYLLTRSAVTALVATRIYAVRAPQTSTQNKVEPHIIYKLYDGGTRYYHSQGSSGLVASDIELLMVAPTYKQSRDIYEAIRNEVDGFSGIWNDITIDNALLSPPATSSGSPRHGDDVGYPATRGIVTVFYTEPLPVPVNP